MKTNYTNVSYQLQFPQQWLKLNITNLMRGFYIIYYVYVEFKREFKECIEFPEKSIKLHRRPIIGCKRLYG